MTTANCPCVSLKRHSCQSSAVAYVDGLDLSWCQLLAAIVSLTGHTTGQLRLVGPVTAAIAATMHVWCSVALAQPRSALALTASNCQLLFVCSAMPSWCTAQWAVWVTSAQGWLLIGASLKLVVVVVGPWCNRGVSAQYVQVFATLMCCVNSCATLREALPVNAKAACMMLLCIVSVFVSMCGSIGSAVTLSRGPCIMCSALFIICSAPILSIIRLVAYMIWHLLRS